MSPLICYSVYFGHFIFPSSGQMGAAALIVVSVWSFFQRLTLSSTLRWGLSIYHLPLCYAWSLANLRFGAVGLACNLVVSDRRIQGGIE